MFHKKGVSWKWNVRVGFEFIDSFSPLYIEDRGEIANFIGIEPATIPTGGDQKAYG